MGTPCNTVELAGCHLVRDVHSKVHHDVAESTSPGSPMSSLMSSRRESPIDLEASRPSQLGQLTAATQTGFCIGEEQQNTPSHPDNCCPHQLHLEQPRRFCESRKTPLSMQARPFLPSPPGLSREPSPVDYEAASPGMVDLTSSGVGKPDVQQSCQIVWCDHKAFKDEGGALREQLVSATGIAVHSYKTAANCIRMLNKKRQGQSKTTFVLLVSLKNAREVLAYLAEASHVKAKVVVQMQHTRTDNPEHLAATFPYIEEIVNTWNEAVDSICRVLAGFETTENW